MRRTKHTPGPWIADYFDRIDSRDGQIAILNRGMRDGQCAANARLIAAAPLLLDKLKEAVEFTHDSTLRCQEWKKLIQLIEGEEADGPKPIKNT